MKTLNSKSATRVKATAIAVAIVGLPTQALAVEWNKIAHWPFDGGSGLTTAADWWGASNAGRVLDTSTAQSGRLGGWAFLFTGKNKNSRVVVDNNSGLSPGTKDFLIRTKMKFSHDLPVGSSWNVIQRGRSSDPGGHWKIELLRKKSTGDVVLHCVFRRPGPAPKIAYSIQVLDRGQSLKRNVFYELSCRINRSSNANTLITGGVRNLTTKQWTFGTKNTQITNAAFGSIAPGRSSNCPLGGKTTLGGKAYCANEQPGVAGLRDDMFRGYLSWAKIWKGK